MYINPAEITTVFIKTIKNHNVFKGNSRESLDENHEKEGTTTKDYAGNLIVSLGDSL